MPDEPEFLDPIFILWNGLGYRHILDQAKRRKLYAMFGLEPPQDDLPVDPSAEL